MPEASEPDAVRVKHRDRFIKEAVSKGKFVMSAANSAEELADQLFEDLKQEAAAEEPPPVIEVTEEAQAEVEPVEHKEAHEKPSKHSKHSKVKKP